MTYKYYNGKRFVGGTAALLHKIKEDGGLNNHYQKIISKIVPVLIEEMIAEENRKSFIKIVK